MRTTVSRNIQADIAFRMEYMMKMRNVSQKEVAARSGLDAALICRYVNGKQAPNAENLVKISDALGVTPDMLLGIRTCIITCGECYWWERETCGRQGRCILLGLFPTEGWFCANAVTPEQYRERKAKLDEGMTVRA